MTCRVNLMLSLEGCDVLWWEITSWYINWPWAKHKLLKELSAFSICSLLCPPVYIVWKNIKRKRNMHIYKRGPFLSFLWEVLKCSRSNDKLVKHGCWCNGGKNGSRQFMRNKPPQKTNKIMTNNLGFSDNIAIIYLPRSSLKQCQLDIKDLGSTSNSKYDSAALPQQYTQVPT